MLLMHEPDFSFQVIEELILTNWISNHQDTLYCAIGCLALGGDDVEASKVLKLVYL